MTRRIATLFTFVFAIALLVLSPPVVQAQTTYVQTPARACLLNDCTKAEFNPQALLSYYIPSIKFLQTQAFPAAGTTAYAYWCTGSLTCTQTEYTDFAGTLTRTTNGTDPNCPLSTQCFELKGTFNSGHNAVDEKWECFRSCGTANNLSGSVTVQ